LRQASPRSRSDVVGELRRLLRELVSVVRVERKTTGGKMGPTVVTLKALCLQPFELEGKKGRRLSSHRPISTRREKRNARRRERKHPILPGYYRIWEGLRGVRQASKSFVRFVQSKVGGGYRSCPVCLECATKKSKSDF